MTRLKAEGILVGRHRVVRIMRINGLSVKAARKYKATTHSKYSLPVAPNLLGQDFSAASIVRRFTRNCSEHTGWFAA